MSVVRFLAPLLVVCLLFPLSAVAQNLTYYLCAILQGSSYQSIDTATLVVSPTTSQRSDYNGNTNTAYQALAIATGSRSYTDLTVAGSPASVTAMTSLAAPGGIGGNDNYFWPGTLPQQLDGDGLTFNFASNITINGQPLTGRQMDLWWESGSNSLSEEVNGGRHETTPMQSTLIISTTQPSCTVPNYAQFSMCAILIGSGYSTTLQALVNTTGTPATVSVGGKSLQGWTVTSASGTRLFTPSSGSATSTAINSIPATNSLASNDNLVFPDSTGSPVFDSNGVAFGLASAAPFAGSSQTANQLAIKFANGQYYEQTASATETSTASYIGFVPYVPQAGAQLPPCQLIATNYQFCWSVQGSGNFSSVISGTMTISPVAGGTAALPFWTILSVSGTRVYTDYTTGQTTTSTITGLLPIGSIGGNDNKLFLGQKTLLDGDGFSVSFSNTPPVFGQNVAGQTNTMVSTQQH